MAQDFLAISILDKLSGSVMAFLAPALAAIGIGGGTTAAAAPAATAGLGSMVGGGVGAGLSTGGALTAAVPASTATGSVGAATAAGPVAATVPTASLAGLGPEAGAFQGAASAPAAGVAPGTAPVGVTSSSTGGMGAADYLKAANEGQKLYNQNKPKQQGPPLSFAPTPPRPRQPMPGAVARQPGSALERYLMLVHGGM